mgnify:CR=1 FL=1
MVQIRQMAGRREDSARWPNLAQSNMSAKSLKAWRAKPQNQRCACGRKAVACKFGEMVCAVCLPPPVKKDFAGKRRGMLVHVESRVLTEKYELARGEEAPICGASLEILEARLKAA